MQTITQKTLEETMYYEDIPVLVYKINYPFFTTTCNSSSARSINEYYEKAAQAAGEYGRTVLYPQAVENVRYRQTNNPPFNSHTLAVNYNVTYNKGCITSLYSDTYTYQGGVHGETKRVSNTWDFNTGSQLRLSDVYPMTRETMSLLLSMIEHQVTGRLIDSPGSYFENYKTLLQNTFNSDSFYIRPGRFVIYYQQYDIAPYASGLPEFYFCCTAPPYPIKSHFNRQKN